MTKDAVNPGETTTPVTPSATGVFPDPVLPRYSGFEVAAGAAVEQLHHRFGMDLWMVTRVEGDHQVVVASAGPWTRIAPERLTWLDSFCRIMTERQGPTVAPDIRKVPAYAEVATGVRAQVRAYVGVPLHQADGSLYGTLCAYAGSPQPDDIGNEMSIVILVAQMLCTIRDHELAEQRAWDAAERDRLTGLRNREGWQAALEREEQRCQRYGGDASVVVLDLDELKLINDARGHVAGDALLISCAESMRAISRPGDTIARLGGDEFGLLAVNCDVRSARSLVARFRVQLRKAGLAVSVGTATRRVGENLEQAWERADIVMYASKRRRRRARAMKTGNTSAAGTPSAG